MTTGPMPDAAPDATPVPPDRLDGPDVAGRLVRGTVLRFASYAGGSLLAVASFAALSRHLGPVEFGQYTTIMSLVTVIATVTDSGMSSLGIREYATLRGTHRDRLLRNLLGLRVALTLGGVVIIVVWSLAAGYGNALLLGGIAAGLATVALVFQHTLTIPLSTDLRLGSVSALELLRQALTVAGILTLVALGAGLFPLLAVTLAANIVLILPTAAIVRGRISLRPSVRPREWSALWRATVVFSLATAVATIYAYTAQILTGFATSGTQEGLFAASFRVFIVAANVPPLVVSQALPLLARAARDDRNRLAQGMQRIFEASLVAGVGTALVISAGAHFIVLVIAGRAYAAASPVLALQAWAMIATFLIANWTYGLLSLHLHRQLLVVSVIAFAVSAVLTLVLAHADGARGAAIATIAGETTVAVGSLIALVRHGAQYRPRLGRAVRVVPAGAFAACLAFIPAMPSVARAAVAIVSYALAVLALRALPAELRLLLPARRMRRDPPR